MSLVNISGQVVAVSSGSEEELHVSGLKAGFYFLRIEFINHPPQVVKVVKK